MFIDYLTLMLVNMVAGLCILAAYLWKGIDEPDQAKWAAAFAMPGSVALLCGFHMIMTWPLPGSFNSAYGELSVLFGVLFAGAAVALAKGRDLLPVALYAPFAGLASAVIGVRFVDLGMSSAPLMTGAGFVLTGLAGLFAAPTIYFRSNRGLRAAGVVVLLAAAAIWALTGYVSLWMHMETFANWAPGS